VALKNSGSQRRRRRVSRVAPSGRRGTRALPAVAQQLSLGDAVARTVADAQDVGRDLGNVSASLARGTVRLAYDLGTVLSLAARNLITGTVEAAETIVRSTAEIPSGSSALSVRKPLARASRVAKRQSSASVA
jgi:hypothetical protein